MRKCKDCHLEVQKKQGIYCNDCGKFAGFLRSGFFKKLNIVQTNKIKENAKKAKVLLNKEYHVNQKSIRDIAKKYNIGIFSLHNFFRKAGIERRKFKESIALAKEKINEVKKKYKMNIRSKREANFISKLKSVPFKETRDKVIKINETMKYKPFLCIKNRIYDFVSKKTYEKKKEFFVNVKKSLTEMGYIVKLQVGKF